MSRTRIRNPLVHFVGRSCRNPTKRTLPHHYKVDGNKRQPNCREASESGNITETTHRVQSRQPGSRPPGRVQQSESPAAQTNSVETAGARKAEFKCQTCRQHGRVQSETTSTSISFTAGCKAKTSLNSQHKMSVSSTPTFQKYSAQTSKSERNPRQPSGGPKTVPKGL